MTIAVTVFAVVVGLAGGVVGGFAAGTASRGLPRRFWWLIAGTAAVCMLLDFVGLVLAWPWLAYGALGVMGGMLTGLKYGYSEIINPWRATDPTTFAEAIDPDESFETHDDPTAE